MSNQVGTGMVAVTVRGASRLPDGTRAALESACDTTPLAVNGIWVGTWGLAGALPSQARALLLTSTNQSDTGTVAPDVIAHWLAEGDLTNLGRMLPPFGALGLTPDGLRLTTDQLGFRNIFRCDGDGWSAVSTSALLLARMLGKGLDTTSARLQSQLGWQVGTHTLFEGVSALAPRESLALSQGDIRSEWIPEAARPEPLSPAEGADLAARGLRELLTTYLDEGHDPTLQLTGGQDSRIVLSAIPETRRRGLKVMTLEVAGSPDAAIANAIATRYGMKHTVHSLTGLNGPSPEHWFERVLETAHTHDCMADPVARSVTDWAEDSFEQGHRLSGLGGEMARGFYYVGSVRPRPVTRRRTEQLARWRMLANDAVDLGVLAEPYRDARDVSVDLIHGVISEAGPEWFTATDEFYLHRMRRWAGLGEAAVAFRRTLINPMLDHRFLDVVARISPAGRKGARFLGLVQLALDKELASMPLDDRPPPKAYAHPGTVNALRTKAPHARKLARKALQRLRGSRRPPAGAAVISDKLNRHFHNEPTVLDPARGSGLFDGGWLEDVARGRTLASASSLALLMNVIAAGREGAL